MLSVTPTCDDGTRVGYTVHCTPTEGNQKHRVLFSEAHSVRECPEKGERGFGGLLTLEDVDVLLCIYMHIVRLGRQRPKRVGNDHRGGWQSVTQKRAQTGEDPTKVHSNMPPPLECWEHE